MHKKILILVSSVVFSQLLPVGTASATMLSEMTSTENVSLHDSVALVDNVALGDSFGRVDQSKGLKIGDKFTLRPMSRVQEQCDSNVFLTKDNKKADWATTFDVGGEAEMKMDKIHLLAGYIFDMNRYAIYSNQDSYNHTAIAKAGYEFTNFDFIVDNKFKKFSDISGTEVTVRIPRIKNVLSADLVTTKLEKVGFDSGYDFIVEDYLSNDPLTIIDNQTVTYRQAESRRENVFREEFTHQTFPKTSLLAEVDGGFIDYNNNYRPNSYFVQGLAGLKGELFKDSVAALKVGYRFQNYNQSGFNDFSGVVLLGNIAKKFGVKNTVTLSAERSVEESVYDGMNYFVLNNVGLYYVYQHNDKLSLHFAGSFQRNQYPKETTEGGLTATRHDDFLVGACGLRYDIRQWLSTAISYQFTKRQSTFDTFDYVDNLFSWSAAAQF